MKGLGRNAKQEVFQQEALPHFRSLYHAALHSQRDPQAAEDAVQETYRQAWQSFHQYQPGSNCKAWLFRILFRVLARQRRAEQTWQLVPLEEARADQLSREEPAGLKGRDLLKVLEGLPEHYRVILVLADVEEFRYREIADMLQLPLGTVMSRLNRARELFRTRWRNLNGQVRSA